VQAGDAETTAVKLRTHFETFFKNQGLFASQPSAAANALFMPFPQNTIRFGLYPPVELSRLSKKDNKFSTEFSSIVTGGLAGEDIDDETVVTFAFYLYIALLKVINLFNNQGLRDEFLSSYQVTDSSIPNIEFFETKYEHSKSIFQEIYNDIMNNEGTENFPAWLSSWINLAKEIMIHFKSKKKKNAIAAKTTMHYLGALINSTLGIGATLQAVLFFCISETLKTSINNNQLTI